MVFWVALRLPANSRECVPRPWDAVRATVSHRKIAPQIGDDIEQQRSSEERFCSMGTGADSRHPIVVRVCPAPGRLSGRQYLIEKTAPQIGDSQAASQ